jgi:pimeloyl-ACP methyl ester carboxylesterase
MMSLLAGHGIDPGQPAAPLAAVAASLPEIIDLKAEDLARFDFPVLGLAGETDEERANIENLADGVTDFRFVLIPGADHLAAPLSPVFTEAVTGFLTD